MISFPGDIRKFSRRAAMALVLLSIHLLNIPAQAQELGPRLQIGIGILPAVIAANKRLADETEQSLPIYVVYKNNRHLAERLVSSIEKIERIRNRQLVIEPAALTDLTSDELEPASTIFIAEELDGDLDELIEFVERQKVLLFSPFKGDVERGVAAGFRVTDKVLPMVNMTALKQSNIQLKAFFLRVAVKHE